MREVANQLCRKLVCLERRKGEDRVNADWKEGRKKRRTARKIRKTYEQRKKRKMKRTRRYHGRELKIESIKKKWKE